MAFRFLLFAAALAVVNGGFLPGAVVQYSSAADVSSSYFNQALPQVAIAHPQPVPISYQAPVAQISTGYLPSIRQSVPISSGHHHQSVIRSPLGGSISQYSKSLDSAYSSVRKYDTRITNDLHVHPVQPIVQRYAHAQPIVSSSLIQPLHQQIVQTAPVVQRLAQPVVAHGPLVGGPIVQRYAEPLNHGSILQTSLAGPVVSHVTYSSPLTSYSW